MKRDTLGDREEKKTMLAIPQTISNESYSMLYK